MGDIVPSMVDGLKESERILLFCAFKKYGFDAIAVEQLAKDSYKFTPRAKYLLPNRVAAIFQMAGTKNINLFVPIGDFGSRFGALVSVPDFTSGTDLMVKLNPVARMLFHKDDDLVAMNVFKGCEGCGSVPSSLLPIIPLILVNGTDCTISGYRSYVPKYKPKDIIANLICLLKKEMMKPMIPWFEEFKGSVETCQDDNAKFIVAGAIDNIDYDTKTVQITELPIGILAQDYIKLLEDGSIPNKGFVDSSDYHNQSLCLRVSLMDEDCKMDVKHLLERLKLTSIISLKDMYLIDASGVICKYDSPLEVIRRFYDFRLQFFWRRKELLMEEYSRKLKELDNEIDESCSAGEQCLNLMKLAKGRLPPDLENFFDGFTDQNIRKIEEATISVGYTDEAENILATLLKIFLTSKKLLPSKSVKEPPIVKVNGQSNSRDPFVLLETAENQIRRMMVVLKALKRLRCNRSTLLQKVDDLKQADAPSLWLNDLHQLEAYLAEQDNFSLLQRKV